VYFYFYIYFLAGSSNKHTLLLFFQAYPAVVGRVIYCSRTVPELIKVVEELKRLVKYYENETGQEANTLGLALSSRKNLCVHPRVR